MPPLNDGTTRHGMVINDAFPLPSATIVKSGRTIRAEDASRIIDAVYLQASDFDRWRRAVAASASRILGPSVDVDLELVDGGLARGSVPADVLQIVGNPDTDATIVMSFAGISPASLTRHEHEAFGRIALHLESAVRLQRAPSNVRAALSLDGELLGPVDPTAPFRRQGEQAEALWLALVNGKATLVLSKSSPSRYFVLDALPSWQRRRALSEVEKRVVTLAARGGSGKALSYALGLSAPAVSRLLATAAAKMGARSRSALVRVAAGLAIDDPPRIPREILTTAEREVLTLVRAGLSNEEIARARGRSHRTIANQVATILRKSGSSTRRALAALHLRGPDQGDS